MDDMKVDEVRKCFDTLIWSGGSEASPEVIWAANDFMKMFLNKEDILLLEEDSSNWEDFIEQLNLLRG